MGFSNQFTYTLLEWYFQRPSRAIIGLNGSSSRLFPPLRAGVSQRLSLWLFLKLKQAECGEVWSDKQSQRERTLLVRLGLTPFRGLLICKINVAHQLTFKTIISNAMYAKGKLNFAVKCIYLLNIICQIYSSCFRR